MIVFTMMRQIERWVNRKLKSIGGGQYKFKINILDVTYYNRDEMHNRFIKEGQYGMPVRSAILATNGYSPSDIENMAYLENSILKLGEREIPLRSSNTQSGSGDDTTDDGGRPTNKSKGEKLTDAGEKSKDYE